MTNCNRAVDFYRAVIFLGFDEIAGAENGLLEYSHCELDPDPDQENNHPASQEIAR
jgi:hypothetical protein